jgi:hypothetical protein
MQIFTLDATAGQPGPNMTLKHFEMLTEQRLVAQQVPPESPSGLHKSGSSDESLDSMASSMATNSAGPRLARAPVNLTTVPEKWLKRSLMLDAMPLQGTYLAKNVLVCSAKSIFGCAICANCSKLLCHSLRCKRKKNGKDAGCFVCDGQKVCRLWQVIQIKFKLDNFVPPMPRIQNFQVQYTVARPPCHF